MRKRRYHIKDFMVLAWALFVVACTPTTDIQSIKVQDYDKKPERIFIIENMGVASDDDVRAFNEAFLGAMHACGLVTQVFRPSPPPASKVDLEHVRKAASALVQEYKPDVVLEVGEISHKTLYRKGLSLGSRPYKYGFILKDLDKKKLWEAHIEPHEFFSLEEDLYTAIATDGFAKMKQDAVIPTCPNPQ